MISERLLTVKFVYAAEDHPRMEGLSQAVAREVFAAGIVKNSGSFKLNDNNKVASIEKTFDVETRLKLSDAFAVIEDMVGAEDVVLTTISIKGEDLVTVTHRNTFEPKALQIAS